MNPAWIRPDWPAPPHVRAFATTRAGGVSEGEFASLNLGGKGGDDPARIERNREILREHLPERPQWLVQVHGAASVRLESLPPATAPRADGAVTSRPGRVCAILTADCMPLLLCAEDGSAVGAVHAGWRGLAAGVIESGVAALGVDPARVLAWMGPTIGPAAYEVGPEVREAFLAADPGAGEAFAAHRPGKFLADLYALARRRLARTGVTSVHGGGFCTFTERDRFFSYRRTPASGRMGTFAWIQG